MDNFYVCPRCEAADREIDKLEARLDAADRETLATFVVDRARLDAADALATEVSPAIEIVKAACVYIRMIGTGGERDERVIKALRTISGDLHTALRKYREASDG